MRATLRFPCVTFIPAGSNIDTWRRPSHVMARLVPRLAGSLCPLEALLPIVARPSRFVRQAEQHPNVSAMHDVGLDQRREFERTGLYVQSLTRGPQQQERDQRHGDLN